MGASADLRLALDCQDEAGLGPAFLRFPQLALPQSDTRVFGRNYMLDLMMLRRRWLLHHSRFQISDKNSGVEILTQLCDSLLLNRPYMHPEQPRGRRRAFAFHENLVSNAANTDGLKRKGVTGCNTGEQTHHMLLGWRAMKPPLQILCD